MTTFAKESESAHAADALPSWNEVPAKQAIDEVKRVLTLHAHN